MTTTTKKLTTSQSKTLNGLSTTSSKIRYLDSIKWSRVEITKVLKYKDGRPIIYQHVRNVLVTPLKKVS